MPVTNYYTVNGQIIAEQAAGQPRVDYLTDALGSVTATVNQSAQVVNTYRYKPYGELLAKTGAGADPALGWVGSRGYRPTGSTYSNTYVRARHYSSKLGRWPTNDPTGLVDGLNRYRYGQNDPVNYIDPSGKVAIVDDLTEAGLISVAAAAYLSWLYYTNRDQFDQAIRDIIRSIGRCHPVSIAKPISIPKPTNRPWNTPGDCPGPTRQPNLPWYPPGIHTNTQFGQGLIGWGGTSQDAIDAVGNLDKQKLISKGVTCEILRNWRDLYWCQALVNPGNPAAPGRLILMNAALLLLGCDLGPEWK